MPLSNLSERELIATFEETHKQILALLDRPGCTYAWLASEIDITDSALKQFVRRGRRRDNTPVRRGAAFERIVSYLKRQQWQEGAEAQGPDERDIKLLEELDQRDYKSKVLIAYWAVGAILGADEANNARSGEKMAGLYYCYRNAANNRYLVRSLLQIAKVDGLLGRNLYQFFHWHYDGNEVLKKSDGMFVSLSNCAYLFGDVAGGAGIDFMIMQEPLADDFSLLPGFQVSIDHHRDPFFAKILCIKQEWSAGEAVQIPDAMKENTGLLLKDHVRLAGIDGDIGLGGSVVDHLRVSECDALTRINMNDLVRRVLESP